MRRFYGEWLDYADDGCSILRDHQNFKRFLWPLRLQAPPPEITSIFLKESRGGSPFAEFGFDRGGN